MGLYENWVARWNSAFSKRNFNLGKAQNLTISAFPFIISSNLITNNFEADEYAPKRRHRERATMRISPPRRSGMDRRVVEQKTLFK